MKRLGQDEIDGAIKEIDGRYCDAAQAYYTRRFPREYANAAFYRGYQDNAAPFTNIFNDLQSEEDEDVRERHNLVRGIVRAAVATLLRSPPAPSMPSAHGDQRSLARAKATEELCRAWTRNGVLSMEELERAAIWSHQCGMGFIKTIFDFDAGDPVDYEGFDEQSDEGDMGWVEREEAMQTDQFGVPIPPRVHSGEITTSFVMSTDGLPDPAARRWREVRYFFERQLRPIWQLREEYPVDYNGDEPVFDQLGGFDRANAQIRGVQMDDEAEQATHLDENSLAEIVQYWEKPSKSHPNGRFMVFSGRCVLVYGPNPLKPARIPYTPIYGPNVVPGSLYPDGQVEDLKAPQRFYNFLMSKVSEQADLMVNGRIFVPNGSGIDPAAFENRSGGILQYNFGYKPEIQPAPELPVTMINMAELIAEKAKDLGGYNDIAQGQVPNGDISGRTIAFATERANLAREPDMMRFSSSIIDIYQQMIWCARQFYDEGRLIRVMGENQRWTLSVFKADDFEFRYQLVPEVYSRAPTSETLLLSETMEAMGAGLFGDTPEAKHARRMLGDHRVSRSTTDPWQGDREKQKRELVRIIEDPFADIYVDEVDEHAVHVEELREFMITPEFENLPEETQMKLRMHLYEHEAADAMQLQDFAMKQQMLGSGGGAQKALAPGVPSPLDGGQSELPPLQKPTIDQFNQSPQQVQQLEQT